MITSLGFESHKAAVATTSSAVVVGKQPQITYNEQWLRPLLTLHLL